MLNKNALLGAGLTLAALSTVVPLTFAADTAEAAVVYCKTVGVPKGCVVRPTAPVAAAAVVTPGVGVAGVGVGAPGVGVAPGTPMKRGGPVNRVGRR